MSGARGGTPNLRGGGSAWGLHNGGFGEGGGSGTPKNALGGVWGGGHILISLPLGEAKMHWGGVWGGGGPIYY